ncbi:MAG: hypothetical protein JO085_05500 [Acidimicrobiia bacterium]|nr:hypothetical protein [Acidimicrobiia bacterium]
MAGRGGNRGAAAAVVAVGAVRQGSEGWLRGRFVAVRCWRATAAGCRQLGWRIGEDAAAGTRRYSWSNFRWGMPLEAMVE